jgi:deoxynogalonate / 12-deoxyaklanonic acid monooxygenase
MRPNWLDTTNSDEVIFVNTFTLQVPPQKFEQAFAQSARFMTGQRGFGQHTLMRHVQEPNSYINIASWADEQSFRDAVSHPEFGAHRAALQAVCLSSPNLYVPCAHSVAGDRPSSEPELGQR